MAGTSIYNSWRRRPVTSAAPPMLPSLDIGASSAAASSVAKFDRGVTMLMIDVHCLTMSGPSRSMLGMDAKCTGVERC